MSSVKIVDVSPPMFIGSHRNFRLVAPEGTENVILRTDIEGNECSVLVDLKKQSYTTLMLDLNHDSRGYEVTYRVEKRQGHFMMSLDVHDEIMVG